MYNISVYRYLYIRVRLEKIRYKFTMLSQYVIHILYYIVIITHKTKRHHRQQQKYIAHVVLRLLLQQQSWIEIPLLLLLLFFMFRTRSSVCMEIKKIDNTFLKHGVCNLRIIT